LTITCESGGERSKLTATNLTSLHDAIRYDQELEPAQYTIAYEEDGETFKIRNERDFKAFSEKPNANGKYRIVLKPIKKETQAEEKKVVTPKVETQEVVAPKVEKKVVAPKVETQAWCAAYGANQYQHPVERERVPHLNDNKPTSELVDGEFFKIDTKAKDPATDEELRQVCKQIKTSGGNFYKLRAALGPFHYNHGQTTERNNLVW